MLLSMLINSALASGALLIEEDGRDVKLVTKKLGATLVLSKMSKEAIYQMSRQPDDPATLAEAIAKAKAAQPAPVAPVASPEPEKVLADAPVPLPVPKRQRPQLQLIQGGVQ